MILWVLKHRFILYHEYFTTCFKSLPKYAYRIFLYCITISFYCYFSYRKLHQHFQSNTLFNSTRGSSDIRLNALRPNGGWALRYYVRYNIVKSFENTSFVGLQSVSDGQQYCWCGGGRRSYDTVGFIRVVRFGRSTDSDITTVKVDINGYRCFCKPFSL